MSVIFSFPFLLGCLGVHKFNHIAHGTFMSLIGARKELTVKNGNEWLGEDSIDDYM